MQHGSARDMRWTVIAENILKRETHVVSIVFIALKNVDCQEETQQVTIMFDHRFHRFLKEVIMSPANQIGKIKDYSFRVEFQQRGSHTLLDLGLRCSKNLAKLPMKIWNLLLINKSPVKCNLQLMSSMKL